MKGYYISNCIPNTIIVLNPNLPCFLVDCPDRSHKYGLFHKKWVVLRIFSRAVIKYTMTNEQVEHYEPSISVCI